MSDSSDIRLPAARTVAVIGGGPAGLMAAEVLARAGATVTVYDRMPSLGRKFLLAGRGGLNLTHSEDLKQFLGRYGDDIDPKLRAAIEAYPPQALRAWSDSLGQETFIGSSGRVFPVALKTSPLLRTWLLRLGNLGVTVKLRHRWDGWDDEGRLRFVTAEGEQFVAPDATVLALGGASWPRLGSDGSWVETLAVQGVNVTPLQPANCGFTAAWSDVFRKFEGQPLKRIAVTLAGRSVRGEAVVTRDGLEGGAIYALSSPIRDVITRNGKATIMVDLLPDVSARQIARTPVGRARQAVAVELPAQGDAPVAGRARTGARGGACRPGVRCRPWTPRTWPA